MRVDQITPSQTRPFEEAKDAVRTAWTEDQLFVQASAAAENMAKELREGNKTATRFASLPGVNVRLSKHFPFRRYG